MIKATVSVVWHLIGDSLSNLFPFEDFEINYITHSSIESDDCCFSDELNCFWQEWIQSVIGDNDIKQDQGYKTVFTVKIDCSEDYFGEVDSEWEAELIHHGKVQVNQVETEDKISFEIKGIQ